MPVERQSFKGQTFAPDATKAPRLAVMAALDFEFMASPTRYDVFEVEPDKFEILPVLRTVRWEGGHNGIKPYKNPPRPGVTGNAMPYIATQVQDGFVHVPSNIEVTAFGEKREGYTHGFQTLNGDWHFTDVWRRPYMVGGEVSWDRDHAGYMAFLRSVAKLLGPIDDGVKKALERKIRDTLARRKKRDPDSEDVDTLTAMQVAFAKPKRVRKPRVQADA